METAAAPAGALSPDEPRLNPGRCQLCSAPQNNDDLRKRLADMEAAQVHYRDQAELIRSQMASPQQEHITTAAC